MSFDAMPDVSGDHGVLIFKGLGTLSHCTQRKSDHSKRPHSVYGKERSRENTCVSYTQQDEGCSLA